VACFAPSILANQQYSEFVADGFVSNLVGTVDRRLGDAMKAGLLNLWGMGNPYTEELSAYEVFGDPALVVNP
jgi:hypothetical protein